MKTCQVAASTLGMGRLPTSLDDVEYRSVWHALAASKSQKSESRAALNNEQNARSAWLKSKQKRCIPDFDRSWDTKKVGILKMLMKTAILGKKQMEDALVNTGNDHLIYTARSNEFTDDVFGGRGNKYGIFLMEIRATVMATRAQTARRLQKQSNASLTPPNQTPTTPLSPPLPSPSFEDLYSLSPEEVRCFTHPEEEIDSAPSRNAVSSHPPTVGFPRPPPSRIPTTHASAACHFGLKVQESDVSNTFDGGGSYNSAMSARVGAGARGRTGAGAVAGAGAETLTVSCGYETVTVSGRTFLQARPNAASSNAGAGIGSSTDTGASAGTGTTASIRAGAGAGASDGASAEAAGAGAGDGASAEAAGTSTGAGTGAGASTSAGASAGAGAGKAGAGTNRRLQATGTWEWLQNGTGSKENWKPLQGLPLAAVLKAEASGKKTAQGSIKGKTFFYDLEKLTQLQMGKAMTRPIRFRLQSAKVGTDGSDKDESAHRPDVDSATSATPSNDLPRWQQKEVEKLDKAASFLASSRRSVLSASTEAEAAEALSQLWMSLNGLSAVDALHSRSARRFQDRNANKEQTHAATAKRTGVTPAAGLHSNTRMGDAYGAQSNDAAVTAAKGKVPCKFWNTGLATACHNGDKCPHLHDETLAAGARQRNETLARGLSQKKAAKAQQENAEMSGTVKSWKGEKGFGFISPHDQQKCSKDLFAHVSNLVDGNCLVIGRKVYFDLGTSSKGPTAVLVNGDGVDNERASTSNNRKRKRNNDGNRPSKRGR